MSKLHVREIAPAVGAKAAIFIDCLDFWLTRPKAGFNRHGHRWVFNTYEEWAQQMGVSKRTVRRVITELRAAGIVLVVRRKRDQLYSLDYERLAAVVADPRVAKMVTKSGQNGHSIYRLHNTDSKQEEEAEPAARLAATPKVIYENLRSTGIPLVFDVANLAAYDAAFDGDFPGYDPDTLAQLVVRCQQMREFFAKATGDPQPPPLVIPTAGYVRTLIDVANWIAQVNPKPMRFRMAAVELLGNDLYRADILKVISTRSGDFMSFVQEVLCG